MTARSSADCCMLLLVPLSFSRELISFSNRSTIRLLAQFSANRYYSIFFPLPAHVDQPVYRLLSVSQKSNPFLEIQKQVFHNQKLSLRNISIIIQCLYDNSPIIKMYSGVKFVLVVCVSILSAYVKQVL